MWISDERKYVRNTLKMTAPRCGYSTCWQEFFVIEATLSSRKRVFTSVLISYKAQKTAQREALSNDDLSVRPLARHLLVFTLLSKVCGDSLKHLTETYYNADLVERECASIQRYESAPNKLGTLD